jgi:Ca-activated chloride channel homolog
MDHSSPAIHGPGSYDYGPGTAPVGVQNITLKTEGINIILAVDLSESMAALDFKKKGKIVNRLEAVKGVVNDFIAKRSGDRIGMVVFGSEAYTQLPLTRDYDTITTILNRLEIGAAGKSTAIGDALGIAVKRIEDVKSKENIIILLTDGRSNSGELTPDVAADIAAAKNVKIYTVGVGSYGKAPFLVQHPVWGDQYVYQNVDIDEDTLKQVASKTGGLYFRAQDTEKLNEIYDTIDKLEKTETEEKIHAQYRDLYLYPLIAAFLLVSTRIVLSNTRFLRIP